MRQERRIALYKSGQRQQQQSSFFYTDFREQHLALQWSNKWCSPVLQAFSKQVLFKKADLNTCWAPYLEMSHGNYSAILWVRPAAAVAVHSAFWIFIKVAEALFFRYMVNATLNCAVLTQVRCTSYNHAPVCSVSIWSCYRLGAQRVLNIDQNGWSTVLIVT